MKIQAIVHTAEEGGFWAEVPALPGCFTQADTFEELEIRLAEAIEGWLLVDAERVVQDRTAQTILVTV